MIFNMAMVFPIQRLAMIFDRSLFVNESTRVPIRRARYDVAGLERHPGSSPRQKRLLK